MDLVTLLVDLVILLWFAALAVAAIRAWQAKAPRLRPLSEQAQNRFNGSWRMVTSRFVDSPRDAVYEADALVVDVLRERGHPLRDEQLPTGLRRARGWVAREGKDGTEALRRAMVQYRAEFSDLVGRPAPAQDEAAGRREMA